MKITYSFFGYIDGEYRYFPGYSPRGVCFNKRGLDDKELKFLIATLIAFRDNLQRNFSRSLTHRFSHIPLCDLVLYLIKLLL